MASGLSRCDQRILPAPRSAHRAAPRRSQSARLRARRDRRTGRPPASRASTLIAVAPRAAAMIACSCSRPAAPRPVAPRDQQERLVADVQHHARLQRAGHAAQPRVELAPAPMVGREGKAGARLDLALGRDLRRSRQRLAHPAAVYRRPPPAREQNSSSSIRCARKRQKQDRNAGSHSRQNRRRNAAAAAQPRPRERATAVRP